MTEDLKAQIDVCKKYEIEPLIMIKTAEEGKKFLLTQNEFLHRMTQNKTKYSKSRRRHITKNKKVNKRMLVRTIKEKKYQKIYHNSSEPFFRWTPVSEC